MVRVNAAQLLADARAAGLTVTADGDRLVVRGPREAGHLARAVLARKAEVLADLAEHPGPGCWIAASRATGRPVSVNEPYPHVCRITITATVSGRPIRLDRRDCAACTKGATR